jgi:hypothetical protein
LESYVPTFQQDDHRTWFVCWQAALKISSLWFKYRCLWCKNLFCKTSQSWWESLNAGKTTWHRFQKLTLLTGIEVWNRQRRAMSSALDSVPAFTDRASKLESNVGSLTNWLRKSLQLLVVWPLLSPTLRKQQIYLVLGKPWALYIRHQEYIYYIYTYSRSVTIRFVLKRLSSNHAATFPLRGFFTFHFFH